MPPTSENSWPRPLFATDSSCPPTPASPRSCGVASRTGMPISTTRFPANPLEGTLMADSRDEGLEVFREMMPGLLPDDVTSLRGGGFADELAEMSIDHVFGALWTRPGLDRRSRSLVTLGALIALRAGEELKFHFPIALRNGLSAEELEEVVYHLTGYVGFPAATLARHVGREVLPKPDRQSGS